MRDSLATLRPFKNCQTPQKFASRSHNTIQTIRLSITKNNRELKALSSDFLLAYNL